MRRFIPLSEMAEAVLPGRTLRFHHSNQEHEIVDWIHEAREVADLLALGRIASLIDQKARRRGYAGFGAANASVRAAAQARQHPVALNPS